MDYIVWYTVVLFLGTIFFYFVLFCHFLFIFWVTGQQLLHTCPVVKQPMVQAGSGSHQSWLSRIKPRASVLTARRGSHAAACPGAGAPGSGSEPRWSSRDPALWPAGHAHTQLGYTHKHTCGLQVWVTAALTFPPVWSVRSEAVLRAWAAATAPDSASNSTAFTEVVPTSIPRM